MMLLGWASHWGMYASLDAENLVLGPTVSYRASKRGTGLDQGRCLTQSSTGINPSLLENEIYSRPKGYAVSLTTVLRNVDCSNQERPFCYHFEDMSIRLSECPTPC